MPLDRARGQPFGGPSDHRQSRETRRPLLRKLVAQTVIGILAVLVPLAYSSPPDATWIAGIYDSADYDDVVELVTDGTGASGGQAPVRVQQGPVAFMPLLEPGPISDGVPRSEMNRGPPVEATEATVSRQPEPAALPSAYLPRGSLVSDYRPDRPDIRSQPPARTRISVRSSTLHASGATARDATREIR